MTDERLQEEEELNAFIDGALGVDARAGVAARAAQDPAYARRLAALSRLKAALANIDPAPDFIVPTPAPRLGNFPRAAAAAACLLLVAVGVLGWTLLQPAPVDRAGLSRDWAVALHRAWTPQHPAASAGALQVAVTLNPVVPDLTANGLTLVHVSEIAAAEGPKAFVAGYLGSRGCRVTLIAARADGGKTRQTKEPGASPLRRAFWRVGRVRYVLMAEGMALQRFELVAAGVRRASLERLPLDVEMRTALARSRAESPPCAA